MITSLRCAAVLAAFCALGARAQGPESDSVPAEIVADTARVNEAVRDARALYAEVNARVAKKQLVAHDTIVTCPQPPSFPNEFRLLTDSRGIVRELRWVSGADGLHVETAYYYDSEGRLRFTFQKVDHVGGHSSETRYYYDPRGMLIRRVSEITKGKFGAFQPQWPARDPQKFVRDFCEPSD